MVKSGQCKNERNRGKGDGRNNGRPICIVRSKIKQRSYQSNTIKYPLFLSLPFPSFTTAFSHSFTGQTFSPTTLIVCEEEQNTTNWQRKKKNREKKRNERKEARKERKRREGKERYIYIYNGRPRFFFTSHLLLYVSTCISTLHTFHNYTTTQILVHTSLIAAFVSTFARESIEGRKRSQKMMLSSCWTFFNVYTCERSARIHTRTRTRTHRNFYFPAGRDGGTVLLLHALFPAENISQAYACVPVYMCTYTRPRIVLSAIYNAIYICMNKHNKLRRIKVHVYAWQMKKKRK